jgi:hypothetical protein
LGVWRKAQSAPKSGSKKQKVGRKAQIHDAKLGKKDGRRAQISKVEQKLLYEIHPWPYLCLY